MDGHNRTQITTLTGNEPQAPMKSVTGWPPHPVTMTNTPTAE
jgi:hypothetical protein